MDTVLNNLPVQLTSFIGRDQEIPEVKRLLTTTRLLTLTGSGGTGKTRLALQAAGDLSKATSVDSGQVFPNGVWFIELASLSDPSLVPLTVASVLGIREEPVRPMLATLLEWLHEKALLLILDNCEHLIDACAKFADATLHASRETRILATSREALGISGEVAWSVPSLAVPEHGKSESHALLIQSEAVRLFAERATSIQRHFRVTESNAPVIAQICRRLDGMPLAIELAATRVKALSVEQIAARLDDRFHLLTGGSRTAIPRHQTLRGAIDGSYESLSEPERVLLSRLSVFAGGWTLEAAEEVTKDEPRLARGERGGRLEDEGGRRNCFILQPSEVLDLLTRLVEKSLVVAEEQGGEARYRMLETIRQYAREKLLEANESERLRDQHLSYYLRWAEQAEPMLLTGTLIEWLPRWEVEHDNLRLALEWACARDSEMARHLAGLLSRFWLYRDYYSEAQAWYRRVLGSGPATQTKGMASALLGAAKILAVSSAYEEALPLLEQSIALWHVLNDKPRLAESLHYQGLSLIGLGQAEAVCAHYQANESILRKFADPSVLAFALTLWARALVNARGDFTAARVLHEESLAIGRRLKHTQALGTTYWGLSFWAMQQGDYEAARRYQLESLSWRRQTAARGFISVSMLALADIASLQSSNLEARSLYEDALGLNRDIGDQLSAAYALVRLGYLALREGALKQAVAHFAESLQICESRANEVGIARCLAGYAELLQLQGQVAQAVRLLASDALLPIMRDEHGPIDRFDYEHSLAAARTQLDEAEFDINWAAGRRLTLEQAIAAAREVTITPQAPLRDPIPPQDPNALTGRELDVLRLLAQGMSDAQIAERLVISRRTVSTHLSAIYRKLGVKSRSAATRAALGQNLV